MLEYRSDADAIATAFLAHGARHASRLWSHFYPALTSLFLEGHNMPRSEGGLRRGPVARQEVEVFLLFSPEEHPQPSPISRAMVHNLPPEILGEIFSWCLPTNAYNSSAVDSAPLVLLRVCRSWHRVALSTPQLWTQLYLHSLQGVNPVVFIGMWLRRSGALPLDVYINPLSWHYPINLDFFRYYIIPDAMKLLAAQFHRVRTLHTTNFPAVLDTLFPANNRVHAPLLRDFCIESSPKSSGHALPGHLIAPNLTSLEICDPCLTLPSIFPNYHNILTIRWNGSNASQPWHASLDHLVSLLQACPNLEECEIIRPWPFEEFIGPRITISLPRLRRLSLLWKENVAMPPFLNMLELPALESLRLEMERTAPTPTRTTLQRMLAALFPPSKPIPPLKALHATHLDTSAADFSPFLQIRTLERLRLEDCSVHGAFLAALTPEPASPSSSYALPRLAELHVARAEVDGARVARFVAARRSSFKVLSLYDCGGVSPMDNAVLGAIAVRGGVSIHGIVVDLCEFTICLTYV